MAFFISSRIFLYYHTLANNNYQKSSKDHKKQISYIPYFEYLEQYTDAAVPNEYEYPWSSIVRLLKNQPVKK